ncbi:MAG: hypothetical protein GXP54_00420 [Deltaproteobacteria bacterium]|nr:hypothetical protein [Deltaproteobacteria bacterium]
MKKTYIFLTALLVAALAAGCGSDILGTDGGTDVVKDVAAAETTPACKSTATTVQESCYEYKDTLCERHISADCKTFGSANECDTWFIGEYGDCADAPTDALTAASIEFLTACVCGLPEADCTALKDSGAEATVPACAKF